MFANMFSISWDGTWIAAEYENTRRLDMMSHRKWRETEQHPRRARSGHQISCCLVFLHFLCDILPGRLLKLSLQMWRSPRPPPGRPPSSASASANRSPSAPPRSKCRRKFLAPAPQVVLRPASFSPFCRRNAKGRRVTQKFHFFKIGRCPQARSTSLKCSTRR